MLSEWKKYVYPVGSKISIALVHPDNLTEFATVESVTESEIVEMTPSNEIKHQLQDAYSISLGVLSFDSTIAKTIRKTNLRGTRGSLFVGLDSDFLRAIENNNTTNQSDIAAKKQALRDFPASAEWNTLTTAEEIDAFVPAAFTALE